MSYINLSDSFNYMCINSSRLLIRYLTKPECQLKVREEIYLDNMLDLFWVRQSFKNRKKRRVARKQPGFGFACIPFSRRSFLQNANISSKSEKDRFFFGPYARPLCQVPLDGRETLDFRSFFSFGNFRKRLCRCRSIIGPYRRTEMDLCLKDLWS